MDIGGTIAEHRRRVKRKMQVHAGDTWGTTHVSEVPVNVASGSDAQGSETVKSVDFR
jgi:hypothetical protein